jgi:cytochrome c-type biogenesis protein CcmH/NrfF
MRAVLSVVIPVLFWGMPLVLLGFFVVAYVAQVNEDAQRQAQVREREEAERRLRAIRSTAAEKMLWIALSSHWEDAGA